MPGLLELPNEILDQIIDDTIPESFEAFSESSMHISSLAKDRVDQYFEGLDSHCLVELSNWGNPFCGECSPLKLLKDILQKPYLVRYPQQLTLGMIDDGISAYESAHNDKFRTHVIKALVKCRYVPSAEIEVWATEICRGNYDAGTALLLVLLSNVRCLFIDGNSFIGYYVRHMVSYIVEASHNPRLAGRCLALSRVVKVHVSGSSYDRGKQDLGILAQLSALPSVNVLRCSRVLCPGKAITDLSRGEYYGGVTKIEVLDSQIHSEIISHLLRSVRGLTHFTCRLPVAYNNTWAASDICHVLRKRTKHTLEELDLTWLSDKETLPSFDGLQDFQVLKKLRVRYDSIMSASENGTFSAAPLTSVLPSSLEELRLVGRHLPRQIKYNERLSERIQSIITRDLEHLTKLFDGLPELKEECLPNLVKIDCENAYHRDFEQSGSYRHVREACLRAGVALDGLPWGSQPVRGGAPSLTPQQPAGWWGSCYQMYSPDLS